MLCPEVTNFKAPDSNLRFEQGEFNQKHTDKINHFYYNHLVSVVLPDNLKVPEYLVDTLKLNCEYYKVNNLKLEQIVNKQFVDNFVKQGNLIGLSINTRIDCDNCVAITPSGKLILSLTKDTYQSLGLEGKVSQFAKNNRLKYTVTINLNEVGLQQRKKYFDRVQECLSNLEEFTVLLNWLPPRDEVCPSSIAKYLSDSNYDVELCTPRASKKTLYEHESPKIDLNTFDLNDGYDFVEWLGMLTLECEFEDKTDGFLSTYSVMEPKENVGQFVVLEFRGFYHPEQILKFYENLRKFVCDDENKKWVSMYVQGFSDSVTNWRENENHFYTNSDNGYIMI